MAAVTRRCLVRAVVLGGVAVGLLPACSLGSVVPRGEDVEGKLTSARSAPGPTLYYLGREFAGLPLTDLAAETPGRALFVYGTCELPKGEGGCAPPIQVQIFPFDPHAWRGAAGCRRLRPLRGVPTVRHDGLVLVTGRTVVKLYARSPREDRAAARALHAVNRARPLVADALPPPPRHVAALIDTACGKRPGESGPKQGDPLVRTPRPRRS